MPAPRLTIDQLPEDTAADGTELLVVQSGATTMKMLLSRVFTAAAAALDAHIADVDGAHTASAVSATASGATINGANVQAQLGQLATEISTMTARAVALEERIAALEP